VLFVALLWSEASAVDVSGIYADTGNTAATEAAVSLQSLLRLEFDPVLANPVHSPASRVAITQTDFMFRIECLDPDGARTWSGQWKTGEGYGTEAGQVKLVFRSKRYDPDGFFFLLSLVGENRVLVVEVQRIVSSWFGPVTKPVGVYVFERAPGGKPRQ
jgi:plasmid stabilization system protein ParE